MAERPSTPNLTCLAKPRVPPTVREAFCREERETARLLFAEADNIMVLRKEEVFLGRNNVRMEMGEQNQKLSLLSRGRFGNCLLQELPRHHDIPHDDIIRELNYQSRTG
jgi:hypothetical protein